MAKRTLSWTRVLTAYASRYRGERPLVVGWDNGNRPACDHTPLNFVRTILSEASSRNRLSVGGTSGAQGPCTTDGGK